MYDPRRTKLLAIFASVALLPLAFLVVISTTDRPLSPGLLTLSTLLADVIFCLFIGLICLLAGLAVTIFDNSSETGKSLMGFGAALGLIFLTAAQLLSFFNPRGHKSD